MSNEYLQRHLNTTALLQIMSAHEVPLQMLLDVLPARLHVAVALSGKCCKDELSGQQTCSKQICMLVRIKPGEVRALFVSRVRPSAPPCCLFFSCCVFVSLLLFWSRMCNEWITAQHQQQQQQQLWSQWSDPGTASDLLHQALREAWQIQHHTSGRRGGGGRRSRAGPKGAQPIPLLHLSATSLSSAYPPESRNSKPCRNKC